MSRPLVLFLFSLYTYAMAVTPRCDYASGYFTIEIDQKTYQKKVRPGFHDATLCCGMRLAALYDGQDFVVFDVTSNKFSVEKAATDFPFAQISAGEKLAGLYDGKSFIVYHQEGKTFRTKQACPSFFYSHVAAAGGLVGLYDGSVFTVFDAKSGRYHHTKARSRYPHARMSAAEELVVLYDGENISVYDTHWEGFEQEYAKTSYLFTHVTAVGNRALVYDGNKLFGFCGQSTRALLDIGDDQSASIFPSQISPGIMTGETLYRVEDNPCRITTTPLSLGFLARLDRPGD